MLAIVGGKGGCGKTTTAVGYARALAAEGHRVTVVDADCDTPNLHAVGETPYRPGVGALSSSGGMSRVRHRSGRFPEIDIVPAGTQTGAVDPATLDRLRDIGGRVVLDCPAGAASGVTGPLRAAEAAIVVSTGARRSREDAVKTARMARELDTAVVGAVLTRVASQGDIDPGPLAGACPILGTVPAVDGPVLSSRVGQLAYGSLASAVAKRNL